MSTKYPGGFVTKSPVAPTSTVASGIWTLDQAIQNKSLGIWPATTDGLSAATAATSTAMLYNLGYRTNGMYWLNPNNLGAKQFYVDFTYRPGCPMVMVLSNRRGTSGMSGLTYANATGTTVTTSGTYNAGRDFNLWVGLSYWRQFGDTVVTGVSGSQAGYSSGVNNVTPASMTNLAKWKFSGWSGTYAFQSPSSYSTLIGSTPGFYSYHVTNGYSLSTYDNDQDIYNGNCSSTYNNNPWWYGACWDGNLFAAGSGYQDGPYWTGSTTDWYAYSATYMCFYDTILT